MTNPTRDQAVFLIHTTKCALHEAALGAPASLEGAQIVALLERVGMSDGRVAFTPAQLGFIRDSLIPWAHENGSFGGGARQKLGIECLEAIVAS
ncbi:MAG: hypothetical protein K1X79_12290 [Oligoflexia bacterium]|nr:hypothetical protein [Oligoflexia bacterium]